MVPPLIRERFAVPLRHLRTWDVVNRAAVRQVFFIGAPPSRGLNRGMTYEHTIETKTRGVRIVRQHVCNATRSGGNCWAVFSVLQNPRQTRLDRSSTTESDARNWGDKLLVQAAGTDPDELD